MFMLCWCSGLFLSDFQLWVTFVHAFSSVMLWWPNTTCCVVLGVTPSHYTFRLYFLHFALILNILTLLSICKKKNLKKMLQLLLCSLLCHSPKKPTYLHSNKMILVPAAASLASVTCFLSLSLQSFLQTMPAKHSWYFLHRKARDRATAIWKQQSEMCTSYSSLLSSNLRPFCSTIVSVKGGEREGHFPSHPVFL